MSADSCRALDEVLADRPSWIGKTELLDERLRELADVEPCIATGLKRTVDERDWDWFDRYVVAGFRFPHPTYVEPLRSALTLQDDDVNNEDIVELLGEIADPGAIGCLEETLWWEPDWDEFRQLGVKCIWALARIGTPDALAVLRDVASVGPERLRDEATRELAGRS